MLYSRHQDNHFSNRFIDDPKYHLMFFSQFICPDALAGGPKMRNRLLSISYVIFFTYFTTSYSGLGPY